MVIGRQLYALAALTPAKTSRFPPNGRLVVSRSQFLLLENGKTSYLYRASKGLGGPGRRVDILPTPGQNTAAKLLVFVNLVVVRASVLSRDSNVCTYGYAFVKCQFGLVSTKSARMKHAARRSRKHFNLVWNFVIPFLGAFAKLRKMTISFVTSLCPSVRPSSWNNSAPLDGF